MKQNHMQSAAQRRAGFSRRHFLRGVGACLALPALESLFPWKLVAAENAVGGMATTASGASLRSAFIFFPNGAIQPNWWPDTQGADFKVLRTTRERERE